MPEGSTAVSIDREITFWTWLSEVKKRRNTSRRLPFCFYGSRLLLPPKFRHLSEKALPFVGVSWLTSLMLRSWWLLAAGCCMAPMQWQLCRLIAHIARLLPWWSRDCRPAVLQNRPRSCCKSLCSSSENFESKTMNSRVLKTKYILTECTSQLLGR